MALRVRLSGLRSCLHALTRTSARTHARARMHMRAYMHTHSHTCMRTFAHTWVRACAHARTHAHGRTHTRARMHAHMCWPRSSAVTRTQRWPRTRHAPRTRVRARTHAYTLQDELDVYIQRELVSRIANPKSLLSPLEVLQRMQQVCNRQRRLQVRAQRPKNASHRAVALMLEQQDRPALRCRSMRACISTHPHTHARTHARTHACLQARMQAHTRARAQEECGCECRSVDNAIGTSHYAKAWP